MRRYYYDQPWTTKSLTNLRALFASPDRVVDDEALRLAYEIFNGKKLRLKFSLSRPDNWMPVNIEEFGMTDAPNGSISIWANSQRHVDYWNGTYTMGRFRLSASRVQTDLPLWPDSNDDRTARSTQANLISRNAVQIYSTMFQKMSIVAQENYRQQRLWGTTLGRKVKVRPYVRMFLMSLCEALALLGPLFGEENVGREHQYETLDQFSTAFKTKLEAMFPDTRGRLGARLSYDDHTMRGSYAMDMFTNWASTCDHCGLSANSKLLMTNPTFIDELDTTWFSQNELISRLYEYYPNISYYDDDYDEWNHTEDDWNELIYWTTQDAAGTACFDCIGRNKMRFCINHEGWYNSSRWGSTSGDACSQCQGDPGSPAFRHRMRNYSFRPEWEFHAADHEPIRPEPGTLFMGMEIETQFVGRAWSEDYEGMMKDLLGNDPDMNRFIFGKSDASVSNGVELVTHPFTFNWAAERFPYDGFQRLIDDWGAKESADVTGCHVHLSHASFSKPHLWKFLAVHEHYADILGMYGRRGTSHSYGNLRDSIALLKDKGYKARYVKRDSYLNTGGRSGLNLTRTDTIEVRYPAGASSPRLIKVNMQFMQALYDFSHTLTSQHIQKGALKDTGFWVGFIEENADRYPELAEFQSTLFPQPKTLEVL